jgi:hypothetical protein
MNSLVVLCVNEPSPLDLQFYRLACFLGGTSSLALEHIDQPLSTGSIADKVETQVTGVGISACTLAYLKSHLSAPETLISLLGGGFLADS